MKYKVSLLPDINRKRLNGKKKTEKFQVYALVILLILFVVTLLVVGASFMAQKKLAKVQSLNAQCQSQIDELEKFRQIDADLKKKITLINEIQVDEPELSNFIATLSNSKHPGISFASIECTDWKVSRVCNISGTATNRNAYLDFEEMVRGIEGVSAVTNTSYTGAVGTADGLAQFTVSITCEGGGMVFEPIGPEVSEVETTVIAADGGAEG